MSKFKIGDKVIGNEKASRRYGITKKGYMGTVSRITPDNGIKLESGFYVDSECFDLVETANNTYELHITCNDGKTTNAVYKVNGKIEKRTEAVCAPSDTFDFATGAQTAFDRVFPKATPTQPIAPQEDKAKFKVGDRVIATDNIGHFVKQIATILDIDKSDPYTPFKVGFDERGLIMWCHSGDIEPYAEPEQPKEAVKLYCVKDYVNWRGAKWLTTGKTYVFENGSTTLDEGNKTVEYGSFSTFSKFNPTMSACLVPLVKRPAKVGEWVLLTNVLCASNYGNGEIYKVSEISVGKPVISGKTWGTVLLQSEYLVLDNYRPEPEKEPEPVYYSGKIVCVENGGLRAWKDGTGYSVKNGRITNSDGGTSPYNEDWITSIKHLNEVFAPAKFIPYLGEA